MKKRRWSQFATSSYCYDMLRNYLTPLQKMEQVKRNANRFPVDFVFQLSEEEVKFMVSQNVIPS